MTNWLPDLTQRKGPRYLAIVEAITQSVESGVLPVGTRLPTHRNLAWNLGVTVGTVSRAYKEATARGLIDGTVGRGTFVRDQRTRSWSTSPASSAPLDFGFNFPPLMEESEAALRKTLSDILADQSGASFAGYDPAGGREAHREALANWLISLGVPATPSTTLATAGAQHAIWVSLASVANPGDVILTEPLTHPGFKSVANRMNLRLVPVENDHNGILPEALESACKAHRPKALFLVPTLNNPTTLTLSEERREQIAGVLEAHSLILIEDDIYRQFAKNPPSSIVSISPNNCIYLASTSKNLAPGLRVGALSAPRALRGKLQAAIRDSIWMSTPLMVEVLVRWLQDGTSDRLTAGKVAEQKVRTDLAQNILGDLDLAAPPACPHVWLTVPEGWDSAEAARVLAHKGVTTT